LRILHIIAVVGLTLLCVLAPARAEKRVALVIGNDRYANLGVHEQLQKAVNDARAVGSALRGIGFDVIAGENLGRGALVDKLDELVQRLGPGDTAFFFFSGHGVAVDGINYILPADVPDIAPGQETRLKGAALGEPYIISELTGRGVRVAIVVLDACRNNPFGRPGGKGVGAAKGLQPPPQVSGVFSLYAAANGQTALDRLADGDPDPNSVFSRVLVPALRRPGLDLATLAIEVREEVAKVAERAGYTQRPAYYGEPIGGRVYLNGEPPGAGQPAVSDAERAAQTWTHIQNTTSLAVLDEFIRQYSNTPVYGALARARREVVVKSQQAAAVVAPPPQLLPLRPDTSLAVFSLPAVVALQRNDPAAFERFKRRYLDNAANARDDEMLSLARFALRKSVKHLLAIAPGDVLLEITETSLAYMQGLQATNPESCVALSDESKGARLTSNLARDLPNVFVRDMAVLERIANTNPRAAITPMTVDKVQPYLRTVFDALRRQQVKSDLLGRDRLDPSEFASYCALVIAFYKAVLELPRDDKVNLLRFLYASSAVNADNDLKR
jgi:hypothetical protein